MSHLDPKTIEEIVSSVVSRLDKTSASNKVRQARSPIYDSVDDAIAASTSAQHYWANLTKTEKSKIIEALRKSMHENTEMFSRKALQESFFRPSSP